MVNVNRLLGGGARVAADAPFPAPARSAVTPAQPARLSHAPIRSNTGGTASGPPLAAYLDD